MAEKSGQKGKSKAGQRAAEDWRTHEHISEAVSNDVSRLEEETGSPELAELAREHVKQHEDEPPIGKNDFAAQLGFASYLEMFEASTAVNDPDGQAWLITPGDNGKWIAWHEQYLRADHVFESKGDAEHFVREHRAQSREGLE